MELSSLEFYTTPEGDIMVKPNMQSVFMLKETDRELIADILCAIRDRYSDCFARLSETYTKSERNRYLFEYKIVRRFIKCNFGEYDQNKADIDHLGNFHFEEVKCPLRGECRDEGIICKPKFNSVLTDREMEIYRHIVNGIDTQSIADELSISPATVVRHRENIKFKIGTSTIAMMVKYWNDHGLN